ncbi:adenylate/guanylate cyclase domain-containing protein [Thermodesulfobacteriota bacterium]
MNEGSKVIGQKKKLGLVWFYARNIEANLIGFMTIVVLNAFTPLEDIRTRADIIFSQGQWSSFFLFIPLVFILVILIQFMVLRPISSALNTMNKDSSIEENVLETARKRILNLPYIIAFTNIAIYITVPLIILFSLYIPNNISFHIFLFMYLRVLMLGLIAAFLSFLLIENTTRKTLIPIFFPKGRLSGIPETIWVSIWIRIRFLFGIGTVNPMLILMITLIFIFFETKESTVTAHELVRNILVFSGLLCVIFILISLRFNVLVVNSILNPIKQMLGILGKVEKGDLSQFIKVVSNDELGVLGDAGNDMIKGLLDREKIRETFGKYVTPEIRDHILTGKIPLNGERREATLLFSDLRDFTSYVENNPPEEVIQSMRSYFTAMQKAISEYNGLVLQYVGDEIETVFGVPIRQEDHPELAVKAAIEMRKSLEILNGQRKEQGKIPFRHGIGIYTGTVLAGNTGSEDRLSYSLIGDTVNLASRIQEMTKTFSCDILVSETTVKRLKHSFSFNEEKNHQVKGYSKPITVYQLL